MGAVRAAARELEGLEAVERVMVAPLVACEVIEDAMAEVDKEVLDLLEVRGATVEALGEEHWVVRMVGGVQ